MFSRVLADLSLIPHTTCSLDLKHVEHQTRESIFVLRVKGNDSSGGRHLSLARRASARWSSQQVSSPV